jgi:hypothetical protein
MENTSAPSQRSERCSRVLNETECSRNPRSEHNYSRRVLLCTLAVPSGFPPDPVRRTGIVSLRRKAPSRPTKTTVSNILSRPNSPWVKHSYQLCCTARSVDEQRTATCEPLTQVGHGPRRRGPLQPTTQLGFRTMRRVLDERNRVNISVWEQLIRLLSPAPPN